MVPGCGVAERVEAFPVPGGRPVQFGVGARAGVAVGEIRLNACCWGARHGFGVAANPSAAGVRGEEVGKSPFGGTSAVSSAAFG